MSYLMIAIIGSAGIVVMAIVASVHTYRFAPALLLPVLWFLYLARLRLNLHPLHYAPATSS